MWNALGFDNVLLSNPQASLHFASEIQPTLHIARQNAHANAGLPTTLHQPWLGHKASGDVLET